MSTNSRSRRYRLSAVALVLLVGFSSFLLSSRHDLSIFVESRSSTSASESAMASVPTTKSNQERERMEHASVDIPGSAASAELTIPASLGTTSSPSLEPSIARTNLPPTTAPQLPNGSARNMESVKSSTWPNVSLDIADSQNRLIVLIASCPYLDLVDNLVQSLLALGLKNYVVVPLDDSAREYAIDLFGADHVVTVPPFAPKFPPRQAKFNSPAFAKITSVRPQVLHAFLDEGYTIFYNDVDVVWRKNIFDIFDPLAVNRIHATDGNDKNTDDVDMVAMVDSHPVEEAFICSCYLYLKPSTPMKNFLKHWQALLEGSGKKKKKKYKHDQEAIYDAYQDITKPRDGKKSNLKATLYPSDNEYFPSGAVYDVWPSEKKSNVYLVHNNFIRGRNFKINRFLKWNLWKPSSKMEEMDLECSAKG